MSNLENFIDELELPYKGEFRGKQYFIDINNSNDFSNIFNKISLNNFLRLKENSVATMNESYFIYTNGEYDVILNANYDDDIYSIVIEEV